MKKWLIFLLLTSSLFAQKIDKKFLIVNSLVISSAIYDVETSFKVFNLGGYEVNPFMRNFQHNKTQFYIAKIVGNSVSIYCSYKLYKKGSKLWWVVPAFATAINVYVGTHNLTLSIKLR